MKMLILVGSVALLGMPVWVGANPVDSQAQRPCVNVTIQREVSNQANVTQNCHANISRIVQLGQDNTAETVQAGYINNSKVRQIYHPNAGHGASLPMAPRYR